jgi:tetratricopeptide (TPR) repeat protein
MEIAPRELDRVRELYQRGLCLQAYHLAQALGPLREWTTTDARILAGRLAVNLGAPRLAAWHHMLAWRKDPEHFEACYYYAQTLLYRRGPLASWQLFRRRGDLPGAAPELQADWLACGGAVAGLLRDFETADALLDRAEQISPGQPWICIERSALFQLEDRYEEALAAARRALELRPWYRPAVQAAAHALQLLGRDREALDLLTEADQQIENGPLVAQLAMLQTELGHYADARRSHERFAELSPLLEKDMAQWLAARRSDTAYYCGDFPAAVRHARELNDPFYQQVAERLLASAGADTPGSPGSQRVLLPVGFVRQHHQTCVPATLAALCRFWEMPGEHLEVAAAICYDGTPNHSERHWAEQNGWLAREFTVTWDSAAALLDRGIPFTLSTVEPGNAHLQAVIGYDSRRGTLIIRDPYERYFGEFIAEAMLRHYAPTGPRGLVLVACAQADRLAGLDLPDAELYDHLYRLQLALEEHDRAGAEEVCAALHERAPEHRLTVMARRSLATYDASLAEQLECAERFLRLYPDDIATKLTKMSCLREMGRREERLALLRELCEAPSAHPVCWQQYAQELCADAREQVRVLHLLHRAIRRLPTHAGGYYVLAGVRWDQRRFEEAVELYRFAACLDDKDEGLARAYFVASRHIRQTDRALRFLQNRFQRFGTRSSLPARTLFGAYSQLEEMSQAFEVLEAALRLRPDDGDLRLFAAESYGTYGQRERAAELLATAQGRTKQTAWLRTAANLAAYQGDLSGALASWRQVLEGEPLAIDAHRAVAQLIAETDSRAATLEHLRRACERFPHHYALLQLWIEWLHEDGAQAVEPIARRLVEIHPADAWARRELALALGEQRRFAEAFAELETAARLEPNNPSRYCVRARLCALAGRPEAVKAACREAIRLSADFGPAISELLLTCDTLAERREALAFIEGELVRQVIFGDGLLAYREWARRVLDPEELLAWLRQALDARPDLWHAWSAVVCQLTEAGKLDEALELAQQATARFPLLPRLWLDLALVCKARQDVAGEREALEHALQINPAWGMAARQLAELHARESRLAEAKAVLEQAVARSPLDAINHGCLADALRRLGDPEAALERVQHALRLDPGYNWAWDALRDWAESLGKPQVAVEFARELTTRRPGEARSWQMLAHMLTRPEQEDERLAALDQAVALNPRCTEAYDLRAELLALKQRFDEALTACWPPAWDSQLPLILRGRAAWVEAQRGDLVEAIAQMRAVVAEDPDYYWGWERLADWYRQEGPPEEYSATAQMLVKLAPQSPTPHAYLGEARLRAGDRAGAKESFAKALELAPDFSFAGLHLVDLQLEDEEWDAAARTLEVLKNHCDSEYVRWRELRLAVGRGDVGSAQHGLKRLYSDPRTPADWFNDAADLLVKAGWSAEAEAVLSEELAAPEMNPQAGAAWVHLLTSRGDWSCASRLDELLERGEIGRRALVAYVTALARAQNQNGVRQCVRKYADVFRSHTWGWGNVGYALTHILDYPAGIDWLADWPEHPDAEPWMLINLVVALRGLGRAEEAYRVSQHALTLERKDYTCPYHQVWLALDEALAGHTVKASDRLAGIPRENLDPLHDLLRTWAEVLVEVQRTEPGERRRTFAVARRRFREAVAAHPKMHFDPEVVVTYRRCVRRIAKDCGGLWAAAWSLWRCLRPAQPRASSG